MRDIKLKPCPFCGGERITFTPKEMFEQLVADNGGATIYIRCENCYAEKWEHEHTKLNRYEPRLWYAAEAWNERN